MAWFRGTDSWAGGIPEGSNQVQPDHVPASFHHAAATHARTQVPQPLLHRLWLAMSHGTAHLRQEDFQWENSGGTQLDFSLPAPPLKSDSHFTVVCVRAPDCHHPGLLRRWRVAKTHLHLYVLQQGGGLLVSPAAHLLDNSTQLVSTLHHLSWIINEGPS